MWRQHHCHLEKYIPAGAELQRSTVCTAEPNYSESDRNTILLIYPFYTSVPNKLTSESKLKMWQLLVFKCEWCKCFFVFFSNRITLRRNLFPDFLAEVNAYLCDTENAVRPSPMCSMQRPNQWPNDKNRGGNLALREAYHHFWRTTGGTMIQLNHQDKHARDAT